MEQARENLILHTGLSQGSFYEVALGRQRTLTFIVWWKKRPADYLIPFTQYVHQIKWKGSRKIQKWRYSPLSVLVGLTSRLLKLCIATMGTLTFLHWPHNPQESIYYLSHPLVHQYLNWRSWVSRGSTLPQQTCYPAYYWHVNSKEEIFFWQWRVTKNCTSKVIRAVRKQLLYWEGVCSRALMCTACPGISFSCCIDSSRLLSIWNSGHSIHSSYPWFSLESEGPPHSCSISFSSHHD